MYNLNYTSELGVENDTVKFNYWERYYYMDGTDDSKILKTLNMGPLGAFYVMRTAPWPTLALTASATLITTMDNVLTTAFIS